MDVIFILMILSLIFCQGGIGINVAQMIVELMRNKRKIVDRITTKHIDRFIQLLGETKVNIM
jgi:inositol 1,4,5-triphosphate receptor type 1